MRTIPFGRWIANAAAGLTGLYGAVTEQAQETGCSRQSVYDHTQKVEAAVEAEHSGGPTREELFGENEALRQENAQLWDWLFQTIEFPLLKQQKFTVVALAMGLATVKPSSYWQSSWVPRQLLVARRFIAGSKPPVQPRARFSSNWIAPAGRWSWWAVSTRFSSAANRSWWGSSP